MAAPAEKLADALEKMHAVQVDGILRSERLTRTYLTRLTRSGFLREIIRGWYYVTNPALTEGSTAWYSHYWTFLSQYLTDRFGEDYCLLPEPSLRLLTGSTVVPRQLAIMRRTAGQQVLPLCLDTSLFIYQERGGFPRRIVERNGLRIMDLNEALVRVPENYFRRSAEDAVIALQMLRDPTELLGELLQNGRSVVAGRLAGAFRHIGDHPNADRIVQTMKAAGFDTREHDPFEAPATASISLARPPSPYIPRLQGMWEAMRGQVESLFPSPPGLPEDTAAYLASVEEKYVQDAYHSLSIEGYRVTPDLIRKVRSGQWDPDRNATDRSAADALAARGYLEAFRSVENTVGEILRGGEAADRVRQAHHSWHQSLFAPAVRAGLLPPATLAGYRRGPVFIQGSRHVPLPDHALADAMETLFGLLQQEDHPAVRAVLGHFVFVFIHPYADGNGRMARFLMNAMFASGGYPWTIIHLENRTAYMQALESASVDRDIVPFASCLLREMQSA